MKIRMKKTVNGSNNGVDTATFYEKFEYEVGDGKPVGDALAKVFLQNDFATELKEKPAKIEEKTTEKPKKKAKK